MDEFEVTEIVEIFPQKGGWTYVRVPEVYTEMSKEYAIRGLVPISARVGKYIWNTSLLPMGDGTHFIALNAKVRKAEEIIVGEKIKIYFKFKV
ncbi:DUF1905 domain-containing protein [Candidatus Dojkabacteria bacterium]|uniref:DUF1905 domain-containing protein n=1 Tax=Candidatus Dojkabacteria bacterium TaxID=2099670 RepID=A0A955L5T5_9BACT|nr:DUF1905 domain-containing protein [Candidatus Dojkabacteria bacterium]